MATVHPHALVSRYHAEFTRQVPLIRDGNPEAIHQGRVATRRLREGLRLLDDGGRQTVSGALTTARAVGRTLGGVRERVVDATGRAGRGFQLVPERDYNRHLSTHTINRDGAPEQDDTQAHRVEGQCVVRACGGGGRGRRAYLPGQTHIRFWD